MQQDNGCINMSTDLDEVYYDESGKVKKIVSENKDKTVKCPPKDTEKVADEDRKKYQKAPEYSPKIAAQEQIKMGLDIDRLSLFGDWINEQIEIIYYPEPPLLSTEIIH
eukprot:TRINITY_DN1422_c0_g1_i2.p1 TRINITY_DN1422_c0_g1~~TRINITY_DN1422_c0_g1_i2.p1  ORF type:complete len:109 (+),score=19.41 TRINITY_DN1422_c0_g1_i2:201-527(+)